MGHITFKYIIIIKYKLKTLLCGGWYGVIEPNLYVIQLLSSIHCGKIGSLNRGSASTCDVDIIITIRTNIV